MNKTRTELLAPAGSFDAMAAAINAGADAVYLGGSKFGARAFAKNFDENDLLRALDYAHIRGKQIFLTVNTLLKEEELSDLYDYLNPLYKQGLDGIIIQDVGVMRYVKNHFKELPIHASTQMTVTGAEGALFLKDYGVTRVVVSRELSLQEIANIHKAVPDLEIEAFIHGAMCFAYSGQCLLSSLIGGRSGNRGRCAQPCRLPYEIYKDNRMLSDSKNPYVLSMKDLLSIELIPDMIKAGIFSFKIEGRMKKAEYTAGVTRLYRKYLDMYRENPDKPFQVAKEDIKQLTNLYSRGGSGTGYYDCHNGKHMITLSKPSYDKASEDLLEEINDKFVNQDYLPIQGKLVLKTDQQASLTVQKDSCEVTCLGEVVSEAVNQPLTKENVEKQMHKTGTTSFSFTSLDIEMDPQIYMSVKALNELRRMALQQLEEKLLSIHKRDEGCRVTEDISGMKVVNGVEEANDTMQLSIVKENRDEHDSLTFANAELSEVRIEPGAIPLHVSIEQKNQFKSVLSVQNVNRIYIDSSCFTTMEETISETKRMVQACHENKKQCFYCMPSIFRLETRNIFEIYKEQFMGLPLDGIMIKNIEEFQWLKMNGFSGQMILDSTLYTCNSEAIAFWREHGIEEDTVPWELNSRELKIRGIENSELLVYGYLPVMTTAQCINKIAAGCNKTQMKLVIRDRYRKDFPVKNNCLYCYNTIYNSLPLSLHNEVNELKRKNPKSVRLHFTIEDEKEVKKIAQYFSVLFHSDKENNCPIQEYTKGHYRRGVE